MARLRIPQPPAGPAPLALWRLAAAAGALLVAFQLRWGDSLKLPFINDDFLFLDRTRAASLPALWGFEGLAFHWWRPWSRETHYWAVQRLAGADAAVFHAVNAALWIGVLVAFWALVRRTSGGRAAAFALAGAAAMSAWGLPLLWVAGVQDLWMLLASLLTLHAWASGRRGWAALGYALALMSKETAALLPVMLGVWDIALGRQPWRRALLRLAPVLAIGVVWAGLHPRLGGQWWHPQSLEPTVDDSRLPPLVALARALGVAVNLDVGWAGAFEVRRALLIGATSGIALTILHALLRPAPAPAPAGRLAVAACGAVWALLGFAPLLLPGLGFHAYYALFGALGVWFAIAAFAPPRAELASAVILALALLGGIRDHVPSLDWGDAPYQRRAGAFLEGMRADLVRKVPAPAPHTRFYFVRVPDRVGFMAGDGPALRVWYGDPTLQGGFYSAYRPRPAGASAGVDRFFRLDSLSGWVEVIRGAEPLAPALAANPRWELDHLALGQALAAGGDWAAAAGEFEKLARAFPANASHAFDAAVSAGQAGDLGRAYEWLAEAARRPGATAEMLAAAAAARRPAAAAATERPPSGR